MRKFISKKKKKSKKIKIFIFILIVISSSIETFLFLLNSNIKLSNKTFVKLLLDDSDKTILKNIINRLKKNYKPVNLLTTNYYEISSKIKTNSKKVDIKNDEYLIYLYNSHQKEEYKASNFVESEVNPTVMMTSFIMEKVFNDNNYKTLVEERSISDLLKANNWKYYKSYDASRIYLDDSKKNNPTLKYFIDIHRDSLKKDQTTIDINGKSYARVMFLIGRENDNYQENLDFTNEINNKLNEKYPNISKGVLVKGGVGVNGVYNQDNSKYTILVEVGGVENNTTEVLNSTLAFCDAFMEVIKNYEK